MTTPGGRTLGSGTADYFDITIPTTEDTTLRSLLEAHGNWDGSRGVLAIDFVTMAGDIRLYKTATGYTDGEYETLASADVPHEGADIGILDMRVSAALGTAVTVKVHWQRPKITKVDS